MKILLISANVATTPYPVYPLGLSMVAQALRTAGHEVRQYDFLYKGSSLEELAATVEQYGPGLIGISIRNIDNVNLLSEQRYLDVVRSLVQRIKQRTETPVVLGGSGFSMMPEAILKFLGADYGIAGEAEAAMVEFAEAAARGIYPQERCWRTTPQLRGLGIPSASYEPELMEFYLKRGHIAGVQTKRGCAHRCVYCSYPFLEGREIRCRDPKAVVADIQALVNTHGAQYIFFTDSLFNDDEGHFMEVVREMKRQGVKVPWTAFFKPEGLTDENLAVMKETGLSAAEMGSDATTDTTLRGLGKTFSIEDVIRCHQLLQKHEISAIYYYMFGGPGETEETVREGIKNILSLENAISFIFMGIRILPGTPLYSIAQKEGLVVEGQDLLEPAYYLAPGIDRKWLERTLTDAFAGIRRCVFPPDAMDSSLQFLHSMGHSGMLWEMMSRKGRKRKGPDLHAAA
ncbi:MAG: lipid biosynthesis B12-binding/radical SAM protein [Candidatus Omnitrophota bacterium]